MFRLKSFSEKVQPIEESLTKPQVKEVFSNNDFKVGLEFEFYNEDFLEDTNRATSEEAIALIVNGYCKDVLNQLPMEFAVEAQKLLEISLEGSVG